MKSDLKVLDIVYGHIKSANINVNGGIYKLQRPINSNKEDIVINSLGINADEMQSCLVNVNVFVPNLSFKNSEQVDVTQPNLIRLSALFELLRPVLTDKTGSGYNFRIEQTFTLPDGDGTKQHFLNIRTRFYIINDFN